jgi:hypothetical protein
MLPFPTTVSRALSQVTGYVPGVAARDTPLWRLVFGQVNPGALFATT